MKAAELMAQERMDCLNHLINLVVKDGLSTKAMEDLVEHAANLLKFLKNGATNLVYLGKAQELSRAKPLKLKL